MSFPSVENFDISFIERTRYNLENYKEANDFTMLINSLLGLLLVPNECIVEGKRKFVFDFLNKKIADFSQLKIIFDEIQFIYTENGREHNTDRLSWTTATGIQKKAPEITFGQFIRRLRNGVAHFGFKPLKTDGQWSGIVVTNQKKGSVNFQLFLTQAELRTIAYLIANQYIKQLKK